MMEETVQRRRIIFSGRVQGVGFRATARRLAGAFKLRGWIKNEPDGTVLMEVQGDAPTIDAYLAELRDRMSGSICGEGTTKVPPVDGEAAFEIAR